MYEMFKLEPNQADGLPEPVATPNLAKPSVPHHGGAATEAKHVSVKEEVEGQAKHREKDDGGHYDTKNLHRRGRTYRHIKLGSPRLGRLFVQLSHVERLVVRVPRRIRGGERVVLDKQGKVSLRPVGGDGKGHFGPPAPAREKDTALGRRKDRPLVPGLSIGHCGDSTPGVVVLDAKGIRV